MEKLEKLKIQFYDLQMQVARSQQLLQALSQEIVSLEEPLLKKSN